MFGDNAGFRRLPFFSPFLISLAMVMCTQVVLPAWAWAPSYDSVVRWIQHSAIPLRTTEPGSSDADLTPLRQIAANASIVGLGEETHGTHEFYNMKARLAEFLMSKMGFTTFVMENNWGSSELIDAYINGKSDDIADAMSQGLFESWQTQEYRSLLEWMRAYNASSAHTTKIHFLGMDFQGLSQSDFAAVEEYLQRVDPKRVAYVQSLYAPLIAMNESPSFDAFIQLSASTKQTYQKQAQRVYELLQANQQSYINRSSAQGFVFALQNARIIMQFATYYDYQTQAEALARYYQRDTFMAENVAWIHNHLAGKHPKMIVWAHDVHIANNTFYETADGRNMGAELRARYKSGYLAIGTTLYQGTFRSYSYPNSTIQRIDSPAPNTYNYTLGQTGLPLYMLDLDNIPSGPARDWSLSSAIFLDYGLGGEDLSAPALLGQSFNVIVHIQNTTPSRLL
jgi:erythromycin esterase